KAQDGYTSTLDTEIMKFQCKVDADASGNKTVNFIIDEDEVFEAPSGDYDNIAFTTSVATVTITTPHAHVYDQTNTDAAHLKTPATCTEAAVYYKSCTCGENGTETFTSGSALGHDYTQKFEDAAHLKTAASNCTEHNIYWFDCSRCDSNAKNDLEATDKYFTSATTGSHSFTEEIADEAHYVAGTGTDCRSVKKYNYDCAYCDQIGTATWDSTTYGPHSYAAVWSSDADGHWHECSLCHGKKDNAAHTPGAAATETTPQKCTACDYTITPALGHTHSMTPVAAKPATCTEDGNKAYYVCSGCSKWYEDATGSVEITDHSSVVLGHLGHDWADATCTAPKTCSRCGATEGNALGHDFAVSWSSDASGHWHACSRCDAKDGEATHTPDREAATETDPIKCSECDYIITAALGHTHSLTKVEAKAPTCTEDGNIEYYTCSGCSKLFADATGNVEITADKTVDKATGHTYEWVIDKEATATEKGSKHEECKVCHDKKAAVEIPATGTPTDPTKPENPDSPQTGDNSMMGLWIALLFVSGAGVVGTTVYGRKKKYSVK
ncbi:MAG: sortase B protein-sorting domain-containing protein, partial [Oscillospiraceae bacterium]|nr:sortase B protein-sorting domain-containing protein [Oscillospiraceae bacterium]